MANSTHSLMRGIKIMLSTNDIKDIERIASKRGSILCDRTIREMIRAGKLVKTDPVEMKEVFSYSGTELSDIPCELDGSIQPASFDITVGNSFTVVSNVTNNGIIEFDTPIEYKTMECDSYLLLPKQFVLATTNEYFMLPDNITAFVEGRSSIGRLGLFIQNAGWVDPGFEGQITLELFNASNFAINIKSGTRVGQLVFAKMDHNAEKPYRGKYQGQTGATGSMIYKDF